MKDEKHLVIHFNNGNRMEVAFPTQVKNSLGALVEGIKRLLQADKLVIHTEERVVVVPWSSVQHLEVTSFPSTALPMEAIKGAQIIESTGN